MIILILGNNYSAKSFYNLFSKDKNNIVFSTIHNYSNCVDLNSNKDIIDFCEANEVNFVLITNPKYLISSLQEELSRLDISVFSPSCDNLGIFSSKIKAKRFMYKNKIKTPKFQVIDKPQSAIEYIKTTNTPQAIKPDEHTYQECSKFCETYSKAQKIINDLFTCGNKKILIEDYIEGKNISVWAISNGYDFKIILASLKYQDDAALVNSSVLNEELKIEIEDNFINPTIQALNFQDEEYVGIIGFDFILTKDNQLYLLNYNGFFDEINVDFFTKGFEINWIDVFESAIVGDVFLKHDFKNHKNTMLTVRQNEKIEFLGANTMTNLERYLKELDYDLTLYDEAKKIWKY